MDATPFLHAHLPDFLADLRTLTAIDCGTHNRAGVNAAGAWLAARARAWDWEVAHTPAPSAATGDCWHFTLRGSGSARVLLIAHTDTVYPDGTAAARPMRIEAGRIYGPGVSDMKAGLLAGLWAMRALQAAGFNDFAELTFFANPDEETGSAVGAAHFVPLARRMDAVLVVECAHPNGNIVSGRKGGIWYWLRVYGRAAHAGVEPEKGANAIVEAAYQAIAAHALNGIAPGVTLNVGAVLGGSKLNVVADYAEVGLDARAVDAAGMAAIEAALAQLPERVTVPGTRVELYVERASAAQPMPKTAGNARLAALAQAAAAELGFSVEDDALSGGTSDANFVAVAGIPVLDSVGPVGGGAHSIGEYLEYESIVPRTALLAGLIRKICAAREELRALRG